MHLNIFLKIIFFLYSAPSIFKATVEEFLKMLAIVVFMMDFRLTNAIKSIFWEQYVIFLMKCYMNDIPAKYSVKVSL